MKSDAKQIVTLTHNNESMVDIVSELDTLVAFLGIRDDSLTPTVPAVQGVVESKLTALKALLSNQRYILSTMHHAATVGDCRPIIREWRQPNNILQENSGTPIELMDMPTKYNSLLMRAGIKSVEDLIHFIQKRSLLEIRGCGSIKARAIEDALEAYIQKQNTSTVDAEVLGW